MASIADLSNVDLSGYERVEAPTQHPPSTPPPEERLEPRRSAFLRCPIPVIPGSGPSPDALRALYLGHTAPITRTFNPPYLPSSGGGSGSTTINVSSQTNISTGNTSAAINAQPPILTSSMTTGPLDPGQQFLGAIGTGAEAWAIFNVQASAPCRIRFYGTDIAQTGDALRDEATPAAPGTGQQDLIADVHLDSQPYSWDLNVLGTNNMEGNDQRIFCTVDNVGLSSQSSIAITIQYSALGLSTNL